MHRPLSAYLRRFIGPLTGPAQMSTFGHERDLFRLRRKKKERSFVAFLVLSVSFYLLKLCRVTLGSSRLEFPSEETVWKRFEGARDSV